MAYYNSPPSITSFLICSTFASLILRFFNYTRETYQKQKRFFEKSKINYFIAVVIYIDKLCPLRRYACANTVAQLCQCGGTSLLIGRPYKASISLSHMAELASLGILQSPLGLIEILPTLGPSGKQERLNC